MNNAEKLSAMRDLLLSLISDNEDYYPAQLQQGQEVGELIKINNMLIKELRRFVPTRVFLRYQYKNKDKDIENFATFCQFLIVCCRHNSQIMQLLQNIISYIDWLFEDDAEYIITDEEIYD